MAKLLADSPGARRLIRAIILILQSYGPFCLVYTIWVLAAKTWHPLAFGKDQFLNNWTLWCLWFPESLLYVFFLGYARYIQAEAIHPSKRTRHERLALFSKVRSEIYDPVSFLTWWFRGARVGDIGREEMKRFINWTFWEGRAGEEKGDEAEIEEYIRKVEEMMPEPFPEGEGKARSLRLTLDAIEIEAR